MRNTIMTNVYTENNHAKMNTMEKLQITRAATSIRHVECQE